MEPYKEAFPAGSSVRIVDRPMLEQFLQTWKFHNPLKPDQLAFAGIPGIWHEQCLGDAGPTGA
jgi:hypothetical protein